MNDFKIVVVEGAFASSVALTLDILSTAAILAKRLGIAAPRWQVCGLSTDRVPLGQGMHIFLQPLVTDADDRSCWIIPGIGIADVALIEQRLQQPDITSLVPALQAHIRAGVP